MTAYYPANKWAYNGNDRRIWERISLRDDNPHLNTDPDGKGGHLVNLTAWSCPEADGWTKWIISTESPSWTIATVRVKVERKCREDVTGYKAFRVSTTCRYQVTVRYGYDVDAQIEEYQHIGGEIDLIRRIMRGLASASDGWHITATNALLSRLRKLGASERQILDAEYPDDYYSDRDRTRQGKNFRLAVLVQKLEREAGRDDH